MFVCFFKAGTVATELALSPHYPVLSGDCFLLAGICVFAVSLSPRGDMNP